MPPFNSLSKLSMSARRRSDRWSGVAAVAAGGLVGSAGRVWLGNLIPLVEGQFPTAVLVVNLSGSFLLGLYLARREQTISRPAAMQFWAIGVLGSFTTFSALSLHLFGLLAARQIVASALYLGASLLGGLLLAFLGQRLGAIAR